MTSLGSWHCGSRFSFFLFGLLHFFGLKVLKYKSCENIFQRDYYSIFFLSKYSIFSDQYCFFIINLLHFLFYLIIKLIMTSSQFDSGSTSVQPQKS